MASSTTIRRAQLAWAGRILRLTKFATNCLKSSKSNFSVKNLDQAWKLEKLKKWSFIFSFSDFSFGKIIIKVLETRKDRVADKQNKWEISEIEAARWSCSKSFELRSWNGWNWSFLSPKSWLRLVLAEFHLISFFNYIAGFEGFKN